MGTTALSKREQLIDLVLSSRCNVDGLASTGITEFSDMRSVFLASLYLAMAGVILLALWLIGWPAWQEYRSFQLAVEAARSRKHQYEFNQFVQEMCTRRGTAATVRVLGAMMQHEDERVRLTSLGALCLLGRESEDAILIMIGLLQDSNPRFSKGAKDALCGIGKPAVGPLEKTLATGSNATRISAVDTLGTIGAEAASAMPELIRACQHGDPSLREWAMWALTRIEVDLFPMTAEFIEALDDENRALRRHARDALVQIGARSVPALLRARASSSDKIAERVNDVLESMGLNAAEGAIDVIGDADPIIRAGAAEVLGHHTSTHTHAIVCLLDLLEDGDESVRIQAATSFLSLDSNPREPMDTLCTIVQDRNSSHRSLAIRVLGKFGKRAEEAIPTLEKALDDDDGDVREIAASSLRQIKDDAVQFETSRR